MSDVDTGLPSFAAYPHPVRLGRVADVMAVLGRAGIEVVVDGSSVSRVTIAAADLLRALGVTPMNAPPDQPPGRLPIMRHTRRRWPVCDRGHPAWCAGTAGEYGYREHCGAPHHFSIGGFVSTTDTCSVEIRDDGHGGRVVVLGEAGVHLAMTGDQAARLADVAGRAAQIAITGEFPDFYIGGPNDDDPPGGVHIAR